MKADTVNLTLTVKNQRWHIVTTLFFSSVRCVFFLFDPMLYFDHFFSSVRFFHTQLSIESLKLAPILAPIRGTEPFLVIFKQLFFEERQCIMIAINFISKQQDQIDEKIIKCRGQSPTAPFNYSCFSCHDHNFYHNWFSCV